MTAVDAAPAACPTGTCAPGWCSHEHTGSKGTRTRRSLTLEMLDVRRLGGIMLAVAAVWKVLPWHPPLVCPLYATTGVPCPTCGMTRAVTSAVRGDVGASLAYNPAGVVLVVLVVVALVARRVERVTIPMWLVATVFGALWVWNLTLNPTF